MRLLILLLSAVPLWSTGGTLYVNTDTGSGSTCSQAAPCASLSVAESRIPVDITTGASQGVWVIDCQGSAADTTAVTVNGTTTSAAYYIKITATTGRHSGVWDASKYRLATANAIALTISDEYVWVDGIQVQKTASSADFQHGVYVTIIATAPNHILLSNLIVRQAGSAFSEPGLYINDADANVDVWNVISYGGGSSTSTRNAGISINAAGTVNIYSSTLIGGQYGLARAGGTVTAKNVYAAAALSNAFNGTIAMTACASDDTTGDVDNVALSTTTFTNVTAGSEDFRLPGTSTSLIDAGADTSGEAAPLNFTTDIAGTTRTGSWEIGAFNYAPAAGSRRLRRILP